MHVCVFVNTRLRQHGRHFADDVVKCISLDENFWIENIKSLKYVPLSLIVTMTAWASYQIRKIAGCACAGNAGNVFPRRRFQRKPIVGDPGMHHGTCVTHVPWCMSGSLTCGDGENVPGIPGTCAPAILRIWQEAHWFGLWLGAEQATSCHLNQWWPSSLTHICFTRPQRFKSYCMGNRLIFHNMILDNDD